MTWRPTPRATCAACSRTCSATAPASAACSDARATSRRPARRGHRRGGVPTAPPQWWCGTKPQGYGRAIGSAHGHHQERLAVLDEGRDPRTHRPLLLRGGGGPHRRHRGRRAPTVCSRCRLPLERTVQVTEHAHRRGGCHHAELIEYHVIEVHGDEATGRCRHRTANKGESYTVAGHDPTPTARWTATGASPTATSAPTTGCRCAQGGYCARIGHLRSPTSRHAQCCRRPPKLVVPRTPQRHLQRRSEAECYLTAGGGHAP